MRVLRFFLGSAVGVVVLLTCLAGPVFAAGDVNNGACSNEANTGFRESLPDCRAYEQVSPVFKDGFFMDFTGLTGDGGLVNAESIGLVNGATSNPDCPLNRYDFERTGSGWVTNALDDAPLETYTYATNHCTRVLLNGEGASLLELRMRSGSAYEQDLYLHRGRSFTLVGPMLGPSAIPAIATAPDQQAGNNPEAADFVASTPDLEHVLFTLGAKNEGLAPGVSSELWPGDTTVLAEESHKAVSLYEYAGTNNETPALVGVDNGGRLLSDCSTFAGGPGVEGDHLNVISENGERAFFTALGRGEPENPRCTGIASVPKVDELFARVNGTRPQSPVDAQGRCTVSADACTVAISQPGALSSPEPNSGCSTPACETNTTDEADFRDANFERASADGSKVFFTSAQQLLDGASQDPEPNDSAVPRDNGKGCPKVTGANGCNLYEYDFNNPVGHRLVLLSGGDASGLGPRVQGVAAVSEDGSHAYFVAKGVLTTLPRGGEGGSCISELTPAEKVEEETTKEGKCRPKKEADNLYVSNTDTGALAFVGTLLPTDAEQWRYNGEIENGGLGPMSVTGNGQFLLFTTPADLTAGDTSTVPQAFRYDAASEALVRVSVGEEGYNDNGNSEVGATLIEHSGSEKETDIASDTHPAISEDGQVVVFKSNVALVPGALDDKCTYEEAGHCYEYAQNVYEYREGHVHLISSGPSLPLQMTEGPVAVSPSGRDIYFQSKESLVPQDTDTLDDIYDAREGGGFAAATQPPQCESACQSAPGAPAATAPPASFTFSGSGNAAPIPVPAAKAKAKSLTRAQKLAKALKACAKQPKHRRAACRARAHRKYGPAPKARRARSGGRASS